MGKKIEITKENCIATTHPQIAAQWHPTLNGELTPNDVREGSTDRVWWLCDRGHEWRTEVRVRCQRNNGCPCCNGRYVVKGETDLESQRLDLVKEWDFEENGLLSPDRVSVNSSQKVGWICSRGHKWVASIAKRTSRNQGCPYCSGRRAIPGETDIATKNPEVMHLWDYEKNEEDGNYPENIKPNSDVKTWWKCKKGHSWQTKTKYIVRGHRCPYCVGYIVAKGETDLATVNPTLAAEWHPTKNRNLTPSDVLPHYSKKVWWKGTECGHEWKATVDHRSNGRGCPICLGMKALTVDNSIFEMVPEIVKDWDKEKNGDLHPKNIAWRSNKDVWWKCENGHSYQMKPNNKIKINPETKELRIVKCPFCTGKRILRGYNDLSTTHPELLKEWDYEKNELNPSELSYGSDKKAWWKCSKNHSWNATISSRSSMKRGCPYCAGQKLLKGFNDLSTTHPYLALEWHPTKNGDVTPDMIGPNDKTDYWWKCDKDHEWKARPHNRTMNNTGCPYCSGRFAITGETDLATTNPKLALEWHPTKNDCSPTEFPYMSGKKIWWVCEKGHEWQAAISTRARSGCPYCAGKRPIVGETDLETLMPEIAEEWNYDRNRGKTPQMFTKYSNQKVWWKCDLGHEWRTAINTRTSLGLGCPECAKNRRKY